MQAGRLATGPGGARPAGASSPTGRGWRPQAGVRSWIGRRAYGMVAACLEDLHRAIVRTQAGVRGWIVWPAPRSLVPVVAGPRGEGGARGGVVTAANRSFRGRARHAPSAGRQKHGAARGVGGQCSGSDRPGIRERGRRPCGRGARRAGGRGSGRAHPGVLETPARAPALHPLGGRALRPGRRPDWPGGDATAQAVGAGGHGPRGSDTLGCGVGGNETGPHEAPMRARKHAWWPLWPLRPPLRPLRACPSGPRRTSRRRSPPTRHR
jgi:hypothetical protein